MTFSMTGYGKHSSSYKGRVLTVEIRTLNSKQTDLSVRMPSLYREKEFEIRDTLSQHLHRGKIDLTVQRDLAPGESTSVLNESLVSSYYEQLKQLEANLNEPVAQTGAEYLSLIMKMPDTLKPATEDLDEGEYAVLKTVLEACTEKVNAFRAQEGEKLEAVLKQSAENILAALKDVEPLETERMERIKGRISGNLGDDQSESPSFDQDRFEQELIYYLEKLDISEEKVRLQAHCDYFIKTLEEERFKGKKLSFISQEMGREINTLGSKAQHSEIQRIVVGMKDDLEKIKEQVLNVL